jgi:uncharacterized protein YbjT (DUF2867 family)
MSRTLVIGGTGRLGKLVVNRLLNAREPVRVLTRRPDEAARCWGERVEITVGDLAAPASLSPALEDVGRVFLLSPIHHEMVAHQTAVIDVARTAGVGRIVKISGSDWTIANRSRSVAGEAHARIEAHLRDSGIAHTVIRPNAWMQVVLAPIAARIARGEGMLVRPTDAPVSFVDAEDIAEVSARTLLADAVITGPLVLTGEEALNSRDIAHLAARLLRRTIALKETDAPLLPPHLDVFERRAVGEFMSLIDEGHAAPVTRTIEQILGRQPRSVEQFLARQLDTVSQAWKVFKGEQTWH